MAALEPWGGCGAGREDDPGAEPDLPDYSGILRVPEAERADTWGWRWSGEEGELEPTDRQ